VATIVPRNGRWRAQIRRAGHKSISRTFRTKSAAEAWVRKTEDAIERGDLDQSDETLASLIARYEREIGPRKPISATKRGNLQRWVETSGGLRVGKLTVDDIVSHAKLRAEPKLLSNGRVAPGAGPATLAIEVGFLGEVLRIARAMWKVRTIGDPVGDALPMLRLLKLIAKPVERNRRPTADELRRLREYWHYRGLAREPQKRQQIPMADIMDFAIGTAMRLGEIVRLQWADLDREKKLILVRDRKDPQRKEGNNQWVPLLDGDGIVDPLPIIDRQKRALDRIFPYDPDSIGKSWQRACEALKIEDLTFHDLRHEGTSRLFEAGYTIEQVALVTGHRDWKSLKRYTQLRPESLHRPPKRSAPSA
jgi:integrase